MGFVLISLLVTWISCAVIASSVADAKGLDGFSWGVAGFLLGPIGLIGAVGMPDRRLRSYIRSIAIKLEAIDDKGSAEIELAKLNILTPSEATTYIYIDPAIETEEARIAAAIRQLSESEQALASVANSELTLRRMGFIQDQGGSVITRLFYIGLKEGKHVYKRGK